MAESSSKFKDNEFSSFLIRNPHWANRNLFRDIENTTSAIGIYLLFGRVSHNFDKKSFFS